MTKDELQKKWDNYWYYYKWHTIAGIFVLIVLVVSISQCAKRPNYDTTIALVTTNAVMDTDQEALANCLSQYMPDVNGDGKHLVGLDNMYIGNGQNMQVEVMNLQAKIAAGDELVFLCDDGGYAYLKKFNLFQTAASVAPGAPTSDKYRIPLKLLGVFKGKSFTSTSDKLTFSVRIVSGTTADNKKNDVNLKACEQMMHNLVMNKKAS